MTFNRWSTTYELMQLSRSDATACRRWLRLLRSHNVAEASQLLRVSSGYADISLANYAYSLQLLRTCGLARHYHGYEGLNRELLAEDEESLILYFLRMLVVAFDPNWLRAYDGGQFDLDDPPLDLLQLIHVLQVDETSGVMAARQAARKVDLSARAAFGAEGELAVIEYLRQNFTAASIDHVSESDDTLGYDVRVVLGSNAWHLEVKAVSSIGPKRLFLSRHEFEVGCMDPMWKLIVVELSSDAEYAKVGTVRTSYVKKYAPTDASAFSRWESTQYRLSPGVIAPGIDLTPVVVSGF